MTSFSQELATAQSPSAWVSRSPELFPWSWEHGHWGQGQWGTQVTKVE